MTKFSSYLPYGWGCRFAKTYCFKQAQEGWGACINCARLLGHPDYDKIIHDLKILSENATISEQKEEPGV